MSLTVDILSQAWFYSCAVSISLLILFLVWRSDWHLIFSDPSRQHLLMGATVTICLLWIVRMEVVTGIHIHYLGLTGLTILLGWKFAILVSVLALFLLSLFGVESLWAAPLNLWVSIVLPITFSYLWLRSIWAWIHKQPFLFIFIGAFFNSAFAAALSMLVMANILVGMGFYSWVGVFEEVLAFSPMILLPEAIINGMFVSCLIVFKPEWVRLYHGP